MRGVNIDRTNRAKVTTTSGTPGSSDKGNVAIDSNGSIWTRSTPGGSWNLSSPFRSTGSSIYPASAMGTLHDLMDSTRSLKALTWTSDRCYFGEGSVVYAKDGTALKDILESAFTGTVLLNTTDYIMPPGKITITYPKTIIGASRSDSVIALADEDASDYLIVSHTTNVVFKNLTITRVDSSAGASPTRLILFDGSTCCEIESCDIGSSTLILDSGSEAIIVGQAGSHFLKIKDCLFTLTRNATPLKPALISLSDCNGADILNNAGESVNCQRSIVVNDSPACNIRGNIFTNDSTKDTNVGIVLTGASAASYICDNRISNVNDYGSIKISELLRVDNTDGVIGFVSNVHIENNILTFTTQTGHEDLAPEEAVVFLGINGGTFVNNKVQVEDHGYNDDVTVDVVPSKIVIFVRGERVNISGNNINAHNSRCALMIDSYGPGATVGMGHRVINNNIYGFSIDTPGTVSVTGLRNDATGIYLSDNGGIGAPFGILITGNNIQGGEESTAIRGCPLNCAAPSWPPDLGDTFYRSPITSNLIYVDSRDQIHGISMVTISFCTIAGNSSFGSNSVFDASELVYDNETNEYGTSGVSYPGTNL